MARFWLHVNHPTSKARIYAEGGCRSVGQAVEHVRSGEPYGPMLGDRNGYRVDPCSSLQAAEAEQARSGKETQDRCGLGPCRELLG
jgi:hypothetical protein